MLLAGCATGPERSPDLSLSNPHCAPVADPSPHGAGTPCPPAPAAAALFVPHSALNATAAAPEVRAAEARQGAASAQIDQAIAARMPSLAFEAGAGLETGIAGNAYAEERIGGTYSYALRLNVPVFEGGRRVAQIQAARSDYEAAGEVARETRISTALELALALADGERHREVLRILSRQESSLRQLAAEFGEVVSAGAGSQTDLDDIRRQLARVGVLRQEIAGQIAAAEAVALRYGVPAQTPPPPAPQSARTADEGTLWTLARSHNARLGERTARIAGAEARVAEAEGEFLPTISLGVGIVGTDHSLPGVDADHMGSAALRLTVPILDGGLRSAGVSQRRSEKLSAEYEREAALGQIAASIRTAVQQRDAARRTRSAAQVERARANEMLSGVRTERAVGVRSTFDEIRAYENLADAEIAMANARRQELAASYVLAAETGLIAAGAHLASLK